MDGKEYVLATVAEAVDEERSRNARVRTPKFPREKRIAWIRDLMKNGLDQSSAKRKLQRWMNTERLSEAEIEASVRFGRLKRLS